MDARTLIFRTSTLRTLILRTGGVKTDYARHLKLIVCLLAMLGAKVAFSQVASTEGNGDVRGGSSSSPVAFVYPPGSVKLRPSEQRSAVHSCPLGTLRLDHFPAGLLFDIYLDLKPKHMKPKHTKGCRDGVSPRLDQTRGVGATLQALT